MNADELFKLLYEALTAYRSSAFDYAVKINASLLVVMGWIVTSDKARDFLGNHRSIRMLGSVLLGVCSALYCVLTWRTYEAAAEVAKQIALLNMASDAVYRHAELSVSSTVMLICANVSIAVICIWVLQKCQGQSVHIERRGRP